MYGTFAPINTTCFPRNSDHYTKRGLNRELELLTLKNIYSGIENKAQYQGKYGDNINIPFFISTPLACFSIPNPDYIIS
jgi:hypothetical protein